jgi:hypothetical protein
MGDIYFLGLCGYFYGSYTYALLLFDEFFIDFWFVGTLEDCFWFRYVFSWFEVPIAA